MSDPPVLHLPDAIVRVVARYRYSIRLPDYLRQSGHSPDIAAAIVLRERWRIAVAHYRLLPSGVLINRIMHRRRFALCLPTLHHLQANHQFQNPTGAFKSPHPIPWAKEKPFLENDQCRSDGMPARKIRTSVHLQGLFLSFVGGQ